jgi:hypothetical protein
LKLLLKIGGSVLVGLILLLVVLRFTGFEPKDCQTASSLACRAPGLWLRGTPVATPVTDWSFTNKIQTVKVQTQTPFLLPYSVSAWCAVYNGDLYLTSYPGRRWVTDIMRDPHVRLKIGDQVFDRTFTVVDDPVEKAAVIEAKWQKYPQWKPPAPESSTVFRVSRD